MTPDPEPISLSSPTRPDVEPPTQIDAGRHPPGNSPGSALIPPEYHLSTRREEIWPGMEDYAMLQKLDEGGQGIVWLARHRGTHQRVAIKTLQPYLRDNPTACERFVREVRLASLLKNKQVPRVTDSGVHRGVYFYAMELVIGSPLHLYVNQSFRTLRGGERIDRILDLMEKICDGMDHVHRVETADPTIQMIVHGDLKPTNIIVTPEGEPKILDFGLAKVRRRDTHAETPDEMRGLCGTPAFMAPELIMDQLQGRYDRIDPRTDVYALGVILYQLLTGVMPFEGMGTAVLDQVMLKNPKDPHVLNKAISPRLEAIVKKALNKEILLRYQSVAELAQELRAYRAGLTVQACPVGLFGKFGLWCRRRERVQQSGYYLASMGTVFLIWTLVGMLVTTMSYPLMTNKGQVLLAMLAQCLLFYLPMLGIGVMTIQNWLSAVWAGVVWTLGMTLCLAAYVAGVHVWLLLTGDAFNVPVAIFILFCTFSAIGFVGYCIALVGYYSNLNAITLSRQFRREKGFARQMAAQETVLQ